MEHAQYMGCSFSEDYKTTTLKIGGENYSVPYEVFSNVKMAVKEEMSVISFIKERSSMGLYSKKII